MNLQKEKYDKYIQSDEWLKRKIIFFSRNKKKCRACGSTKLIHLHHHTYERMGNERDSDLIPLCEDCHAEVHLIHNKNRKQNLSQVTFNFIKMMKTEIQPASPEPKRNSFSKKKKRNKNRLGISKETRLQQKENTKIREEETKNFKICIYCNNERYNSSIISYIRFKNNWIHKKCRQEIIKKANLKVDKNVL